MNTSTSQTLFELKAAGEDHEWYPTTDEIIQVVACDIKRRSKKIYGRADEAISVLDIGAGDGRVLTRLTETLDHDEWHKRIPITPYAIEKAAVHLANMPKGIVVLGTDFWEQTLVDKRVDIAFCNPPYSEFQEWVCKIIRECAAETIYLVIPMRWRSSDSIRVALENVGVTAHGEDENCDDYFIPANVASLGEFDFESADRQARAKVEIVRLSIRVKGPSAFDAAIEELLPELETFDDQSGESPVDHIQPCRMIEGGNVITTMVGAYDAELAQLYETYRAVVKFNPYLLKELGVTKETIKSGLRSKIEGLKDRYWKALFDHLSEVTNRLATKQRKAFLDSLKGKNTVDFTVSNIHAMLLWVTKWSSDYFDEQLIDLFKAMSQKATVERYKSNKKVFDEGNWRYLNAEASHYKLCYRMVLETHGGIYSGSYSWEAPNGLCKSTAELLRDFVTVANNLGFDCDDSPDNYEWTSNKKIDLRLNNGEPLMDVRAFKNGNIHIRVAKNVMLAINVQAGKLLGWLRTSEEAMNELDVDAEDRAEVERAYAISFRIEPQNLRIAAAV